MIAKEGLENYLFASQILFLLGICYLFFSVWIRTKTNPIKIMFALGKENISFIKLTKTESIVAVIWIFGTLALLWYSLDFNAFRTGIISGT